MKKNSLPLIFIVFSVVVLTIASPGIGWGFFAWFALVPLFYVADKKIIPPFLAGLLFGELYYFFSISWLSFPITDIGNAPIIVSWLVTAAFAGYLGLYYGLTLYVFSRTKGSLFYVPLVFVFGEYFRGVFLTGFPWLTLAQTQYLYPEILTVTSFLGEYGLSFFILLCNLLLFKGVSSKKYILSVCGLLLPAVLFMWGVIAKDPQSDGEANIRLIQTNVNQEDKWDEARKNMTLAKVSDMLRESDYKDYDLIVLPETAFPIFLQDEPSVELILNLVGEDTPVFTGILRTEADDNGRRYYNSAALFTDKGMSTYDKIHLVPFGEYFPLTGIFSFINDYFFYGASDYSKGENEGIFEAGKMKIAPLICYEGAFYKQLAAQDAAGANLVVIISNDSWFGFSHGRFQHLAVDVMRAAEFNRWIVRSTQSGISAFIDNKGRIKNTISVGETGYLDNKAELITKRTFFSIYGYLWIGILVFAGLCKEALRRGLRTINS